MTSKGFLMILSAIVNALILYRWLEMGLGVRDSRSFLCVYGPLFFFLVPLIYLDLTKSYGYHGAYTSQGGNGNIYG